MQSKSFTDISMTEILLYARKHWAWMLLASCCAAAGNLSHFSSSPKYKASAQFTVRHSYGHSPESIQEGLLNEAYVDPISKFNMYTQSNTFGEALFNELKARKQLKLAQGLQRDENSDFHRALSSIGLAHYFKKLAPQGIDTPKTSADLMGLLRGKIKTTIGDHGIVGLSVSSYSPQTSILMANLIMELGVKGVTEGLLRESEDKIAFMEEQVTEAKKRLKKIETILTGVKVKKEGESSKIAESNRQLRDLKSQLLKSEQDVFKLKGFIKDLKGQRSSDYTSRNRLFKMKRELDFWESNVASLKKMIKNVKKSGPDVSKNLQLAANIDNLERQQTFEFSNLASLEKTVLQLKMKRLLVQKNIRTGERAHEQKILVAKLPVLGLFASMILAAFSVLFFFFMRDNLSPTFKSIDDIKDLNLLNFGSVPDLSSGKELLKVKADTGRIRSSLSIATNSPESFVFGAVRSKILHSMDGAEKMQLISVTSPRQNEGKSLITGKLATSLASTDKKVLLVDGDVMRKDLSQDLQVENHVGLRDILQGDVKLKDAILKSPHQDNLDILPAGLGRGSVADFLLSAGSHALFNECRELYDIVIFDNLAFLLVPDALLLCRFSDLTLVVGCAGSTKVADLVHTTKDLRENGVNNIGCVVNKHGSLLKYVYVHPADSSVEKGSGQRVS